MLIDYGPVESSLAQWAIERIGEVAAREMLKKLCKTWPRRLDEYVQSALLIQGTSPGTRLPGHPIPFRLLFGGDAQPQLNAVQPEIDGGGFAGGKHSYAAGKQQAFRKRCERVYANDMRSNSALGKATVLESFVSL